MEEEAETIVPEQDAKKTIPLPVIVGVAVCCLIGLLLASVFVIKLNVFNQSDLDSALQADNDSTASSESSTPNQKVSEADDAPQSVQTLKVADASTTRQAQEAINNTQYANGRVSYDSLYLFDIDADGDEDIVGFREFIFQPNTFRKATRTQDVFTTWFNDEGLYVFYGDWNNDFRTPEDTDVCKITSLNTLKVTLDCSNVGMDSKVVLRYQDREIGGYYRDFAATALEYIPQKSLVLYQSNQAGVSFMYPQDMLITENTYQTETGPLTLIVGETEDRDQFEIHIQHHYSDEFTKDTGGGLIDISSDGVMLALANGDFLWRRNLPFDYLSNGDIFIEPKISTLVKTNDEGRIFSSVSHTYSMDTRTINLYQLYGEEVDLDTTDNILASLGFTDAMPANEMAFMEILTSTYKFANILEFNLPGEFEIIATTSPNLSSSALTFEGIGIRKYYSTVYDPYQLTFSLYPFDSIDGTNHFGGGGYDVSTETCYDSRRKFRQHEMFGRFKACQFGGGDAGYGFWGYYLIDPNQQFILEVRHTTFEDRPTPVNLENLLNTIKPL